jgi:hypothetical protein
MTQSFAASSRSIPLTAVYELADDAFARCEQGTLRKKLPARVSFASLIYEIGRGDMIRTRDPLLPKQMLYQAELRPDATLMCRFRQPRSSQGGGKLASIGFSAP